MLVLGETCLPQVFSQARKAVAQRECMRQGFVATGLMLGEADDAIYHWGCSVNRIVALHGASVYRYDALLRVCAPLIGHACHLLCLLYRYSYLLERTIARWTLYVKKKRKENQVFFSYGVDA